MTACGGPSLLTSEGLSFVFRQSKGGDGCDCKGASEESEEPGLSGGSEDRRHDQLGDDRGDAANASCSAGAAAANVGGVELRAKRIKRAPGAEVEEGQEAAGDDDADFGICQAKGAGGHCGAY